MNLDLYKFINILQENVLKYYNKNVKIRLDENTISESITVEFITKELKGEEQLPNKIIQYLIQELEKQGWGYKLKAGQIYFTNIESIGYEDETILYILIKARTNN